MPFSTPLVVYLQLKFVVVLFMFSFMQSIP